MIRNTPCPSGSESIRQQALDEYQVLDTPAEAAFDELAQLAATLFDAPIALVSLIDRDRQWFKSRIGVALSQTPRSVSMCDVTITSDALLIVEDTLRDVRFADNPLVIGAPHVRFYAGAPLVTPEGLRIGTLCVIDDKARPCTATQRTALAVLARQVVAQLELRKQNRALRAEQDLTARIIAESPIGIALGDPQGQCQLANSAMARHLGVCLEELQAGRLDRLDHLLRGEVSPDELPAGHGASGAGARVVRLRAGGADDRWLGVNVMNVPTDCGERRLYMTHDLSESKRAERRLRESEEALRMLYENSMDGVLQTRPDGRILAANPVACALLGRTEAQLREFGRDDIMDTTDPRMNRLIAERARNGRARGESRMIRADGSRFDAEISSTIYRNRDGERLSSVVFRDVTERQVWARRVEDSLKLLDDLAQRVPGVIYQYRLFPDGRSCFPFASQGLWTIYEVLPEEVTQDASPVLRRLHPDDEPAVMASIRASAATGLPWQHEYRVVLPEQGLRWRRGEARPEKLPDGSVLWHGYISDITDRKQTEGALRASLERFRLAASTGNVWAWREGDAALDLPLSLRELFRNAGARPGPSMANWLPAVHELDRDRLRNAIHRHLKEKAALDIEFRVRGADAAHRWLHLRGQSVWNAQGRAVQIAGTIFDVTDRLRAENKLIEREQQLSGIVDTAMDAIITVDAGQRIRVFNHAASTMFRIDAAQAVGQPLSRFIPPHLRKGHARHVRNFATKGSGSRPMGTVHTLNAMRADGEIFPIEASISKTGEGANRLTTAVVRDATALRDAERAREAQVAAEAASRAKSEFISRVSHELRTPLNAMLGFAQLLENDPRETLSARQREQVTLSRQAGWHLLGLIDDLMDIARIETGQLKMDLVALPLRDVLDPVISMNESLAREHAVSVALANPSQADQLVHADPARLRQVLINLITNGIKYNRPGGVVRLEISSDAQQVHIDVTDTGIGMSEDQRSHLFEPFNRLGREAGPVAGTGIGLALTRQLVEQMKGTLTIHSEVGRGTRVRVSLAPGARTSAPALPDATWSAQGQASQPAGTVLYIDDNPVNQLVVRAFVERWPHVRLLSADAGAEGLRQARALSPDLILLDIQLPDMSGLDVLKTLRADAATRGLAVAIVSASAMPEDMARAHAAGADAYWTKPLDLNAFGPDLMRYLEPD